MAEAPARFAAKAPAGEQMLRLAEINYQIIRQVLERDLRSYALFNRLRREAEQP
jgi:hypothetical protein